METKNSSIPANSFRRHASQFTPKRGCQFFFFGKIVTMISRGQRSLHKCWNEMLTSNAGLLLVHRSWIGQWRRGVPINSNRCFRAVGRSLWPPPEPLAGDVHFLKNNKRKRGGGGGGGGTLERRLTPPFRRIQFGRFPLSFFFRLFLLGGRKIVK